MIETGSFEDLILTMYSEGCSVNFISKHVKKHKRVVSTILKENGITFNPKFLGDKTPVTEEVKQRIINSFTGQTLTELGKAFNISHKTVEKILRSAGLYETKYPNLNISQKIEIQEHYDRGLSSQKIANLMGISKWSVLEYIDEAKPKSFYNKYTCNYSFFENIDNQDKAYWLGYLMADGYNGEDRKVITFAQAKNDCGNVYKFRHCLESNHVIKVTKRESEKHQDVYSITINSPKMSSDLAKHGCKQAKTHIAEFPDIEPIYYRHFIRGLFDGDGSVWKSGNKFTMSITGNEKLLLRVQEILINELNLTKPSLYTRHRERANNIKELRYSNSSVNKILDWMYFDANYLNLRKYNKLT